MPSKKLVSVLIPVYNQEKLIIRAIKSIPKQKNIEILICDDCSTDGTLSNILDYLETTETDARIIQNIENRGVAYTMNRLYDEAKGEYVVALGSDDYFTDKFKDVLSELDGTDMVYFNLETNDGTIFDLSDETKFNYCGSTKFIRKEFLGEDRCPNMEVAEDLALYCKLMKKNPTEKFTHTVIKHYNFPREGSLSWQLREGIIKAD